MLISFCNRIVDLFLNPVSMIFNPSIDYGNIRQEANCKDRDIPWKGNNQQQKKAGRQQEQEQNNIIKRHISPLLY